MASINAVELRKGSIIKHNNDLYKITDYQHTTPGKGAAVMSVKFRNLRTGAISDHRFRSQEKVEFVELDNRNLEYLYDQGGEFVFMDVQTYEQFTLTEDDLGDDKTWLKENIKVQVQFYEDKAVGIMMPITVELEVTYTEPGFKGNTSAGTLKPATLETGREIMVPLFIEIGDKLKIDTRTAGYLERV
jgi:elongation factor P